MRAEHYKHNQAVAIIAAAVPNVVSLLARKNTASGPWYEASDLGNVFLSIPIKRRSEVVYLLMGLTTIYIYSLALGLR